MLIITFAWIDTHIWFPTGIMSNRESSWGSDASKWRPSRWLNSDGSFNRNAGPNFPFGFGQRACFGQKLAVCCMLHFPRNMEGADAYTLDSSAQDVYRYLVTSIFLQGSSWRGRCFWSSGACDETTEDMLCVVGEVGLRRGLIIDNRVFSLKIVTKCCWILSVSPQPHDIVRSSYILSLTMQVVP